MGNTHEVHHFVLTPEGGMREFSQDQAAKVAAGAGKLPEYAERRVRYVQVTVTTETEDELKVVTAGASIRFDRDGRLAEAGPIGTDEPRLSPFEHDACVQWALRNWPAPSLTFH